MTCLCVSKTDQVTSKQRWPKIDLIAKLTKSAILPKSMLCYFTILPTQHKTSPSQNGSELQYWYSVADNRLMLKTLYSSTKLKKVKYNEYLWSLWFCRSTLNVLTQLLHHTRVGWNQKLRLHQQVQIMSRFSTAIGGQGSGGGVREGDNHPGTQKPAHQPYKKSRLMCWKLNFDGKLAA